MTCAAAVVALYAICTSAFGLQIPPKALETAITFISTADDGLTKCNNYTSTCATYQQFSRKYYIQRASPFYGLRCVTHTFRILFNNNIGLNTYRGLKVNDSSLVELDFLFVSIKNGQHRAAQLPNFVYFITTTIIHWKKDIGYVAAGCYWNSPDSPPVITIGTYLQNPPHSHITYLVNEAAKASLPVENLLPIDQTNCLAEPEENFAIHLVELAIAVLKNLIEKEILN